MIALEYAFICDFNAVLAGFRVWMYICVGWGLCVDCGAFYVREQLGGFMACCVFASVFILLPSFFIFFILFLVLLLLLLSHFLLSLLVLLSSACPLSLWVVVSFSLTDYTQKRALRVGASSLVLLWVVLLFGCLRNYKTIAGRFNPERVSRYPCNRKEITTISDNFITVSAFFLHHHSAVIVCACLFGAWPSVCVMKVIHTTAVVGVYISLCFLGVVVYSFHCFVFLCCLTYFPFPFRCVCCFITATKLQPFFLIPNFFLTFLYKMFWKRYYKGFPVRMEIIANNAIIIFCHLVEVAIFAISNFFSIFSIAVFNIPISHKIIVLLFLLQSYNLFSYLQIFFNFFYVFFRVCENTYIYAGCLYSSLFWCWCSGGVPCPAVCWSCVLMTIIHNHTHARIYARTRGFLDSNF